MTVTVGALTVQKLAVVGGPYEEANTRQGVAAGAWDIEGILSSVDAAAVSNAFETWLATRVTENDSLLTGTTGTTVAFTGSFGGRSFSNVATWWDAAPSVVPVGNKFRVSFRLVHAAETLAALLRGEELSRERDDALAPTFSSITVGTVALTIVREPEGRDEGPTISTAATGTDLIEGPLRRVRVRNIVGYGPNAGRTDFDTLLAWYDTIIATRPAAGTWFPISPPTAEPQVIVNAGAKSTRYLISLQLRYIE